MAKKYSYRFKIDTLDGQVVNAGGSMTGGSRGHNAGILSRSNEKDKLNSQIAKLVAEQEQDNEAYKKLSVELSAVKADLDASQADLKRTQEDVIRKESELALIEGKLDTAMKTEAQTEIDKLNKEMGSLQADLDVVTHGREKLEEKKEELAQTEARINLDILALDKDIEAKKEAVDLLNRRMASHEGRLDDLNDEIAVIENANKEIEIKIQELSKQAKELHELGASAKSDIETLIAERTKCEATSFVRRSVQSQPSVKKSAESWLVLRSVKLRWSSSLKMQSTSSLTSIS